MKKYRVFLVLLLVVSAVLVACSSESSDNAEKYVRALLAGNAAEAQKYACADYQDRTTEMAATLPGLGPNQAVRNVDLKFDIGKGNNQKEVLVTGSYDIVQLGESGRELRDTARQYELAASVRDRFDMNQNGSDVDKINTRIVLTMREEGDEWCVALLDGGYYHPLVVIEGAEDEAAPAEETAPAAGEATPAAQ